MKLTAKDLMTRDVLTARADWSVEQLTELLLGHAISGAPVLDDEGKPVGVVSITDVTRSRAAEQSSDNEHVHEYYRHALERQLGRDASAGMSVASEPELTVGDIMTPMVFQVPEDAPVQRVADEMLKGRIHRVFVTRDNELTGVLTAFDLLRVVRDL